MTLLSALVGGSPAAAAESAAEALASQVAAEVARAEAEAAQTGAEAARDAAAATAAVGLPSSMTTIADFGLPTGTTALTGSSAGNGTFVFASPVTIDGTVSAIRLFALATGTIAIKRLTKSGNNFTQVGSDYTVTISATGNQVLTGTQIPTIPVLAGELIGFYSNAKIPVVTASADSGGWYFANGNQSSFTDSSTSTATRLQLGVGVASPYGTTQRIEAIEARAGDTDAVIEDIEKDIDPFVRQRARSADIHFQLFGADAPVAGTLGGDSTVVLNAPAVARSLWKRFSIWANANCQCILAVFTTVGSTHTPDPVTVTLDLTAGSNSFDADDGDFIPLVLEGGQRPGFYCGQNYHFLSDAENAVYSFSALHDCTVSGFDDDVLSATFIQVGVGIEVVEIAKATSSHVPMPGQPLAESDRWQLTSLMLAIVAAKGQSLTTGTNGLEYFYRTIYYNLMFPQGPRAAMAGTRSGGISSNGGTSSLVPAEENTVINVAGANQGSTGLVYATDYIAYLANQLGVHPADNVMLAMTVGWAGKSIKQINMGNNWFTLLDENLQQAVLRAAEIGKTAVCPAYLYNIGHTDAFDNVMTGDEFKAWVLDDLRNVSALNRSRTGHPGQPHFFFVQPSNYITGAAGLGPRDGNIQQAILELSEEIPWVHLLGGDYPFHDANSLGIHLDSYGYDLLFLLYGMAAYEAIWLGIEPRALKPLGTRFSGNTVTQWFWSVDPIAAFNVAPVVSVTDNGFKITVNGSGATINSTTIDNLPSNQQPYLRKIAFGLSSSIPNDAEVWLRAGMDYAAIGTDGGINCHTTWTKTVTIGTPPQTRTVSHTCPHFKRKALFEAWG